MNNHFTNLAPVIDEEKQKQYIDLLKIGIDDEDVRNIALSGPYGSGKSSVLKGLLSKARENKEDSKYLEISLANFQSADNKTKGKTKEETEQFSEQLIEKSILQQIFYKVSRQAVPYSRFSRILNRGKLSLLSFSSLIFIWIFSFYFVAKPKAFTEFLEYSWVGVVSSWIPLFISEYFVLHFIFIASTFILLYNIVRGSSIIRLSKLSFQGADIELGDDKGSLLNAHIDEILYFFETTPYEVVIIEDLDRHKIAGIFKKLREINTLINNYENIQKHKKVTFVYAVKDSLFTGEERTKFFEWIVPVIPVINTSNAKDKLITKVQDAGLSESISIPYIKDISYYITDLRQLINIFNEYLVYTQELKDVPSQEKLFSIIIYKNFFPKDFAKLHNREGNVYNIFEITKNNIKEKKLKDIDDILNFIETKLENIKDEYLVTEKELRSVYMARLLILRPGIKSFHLENTRISIENVLSNDEYFKIFFEGKIPSFYTYDNRHLTLTYSIDDIDPDKTYATRKEAIKNKSSEERKKLLVQRASHRIKRNKIKYGTLQELLSELKEIDVLHPSDFDDWEEKEKANWSLIEHLIFNGYIDKEYHSYISYFYDAEMSLSDHTLIQEIKRGTKVNWAQKIDKVSLLIEELNIYDFKNMSVFNYQIAEEFFLNNEGYDALKKTELFTQIFNGSTESKKFIKHMLKATNKESLLSLVLREYVTHRDDLWTYLQENWDTNSIDFLEIFKVMIECIDNEDFLTFDEVDSLAEYIASMTSFLEFSDSIENKDKVKSLLDTLDVKFIDLETYPLYNKAVFDYIVDTNHYYFTPSLVQGVIRNRTNNLEVDVTNLSYGGILNSEVDVLIDYVDRDINIYATSILLEEKYILEEKEQGFISLLNHDNLQNETKKLLIESYTNQLTDIKEVPQDTWEKLFLENKLVATWENIIYAYLESKNPESEIEDDVEGAILNYLSMQTVYESLSQKDFYEAVPDEHKEEIQELVFLILSSSRINIQALRSYKDAIKPCLNISNIESIEQSRVKEIVNIGYPCTSSDNFNQIKLLLDSKDYLVLIEKNFSAFLKNASEYDLSESDIKNIFQSKNISNTQKLIYAKSIDDFIIGSETLNVENEIYNILTSEDLEVVTSFNLVQYVMKSTISVDIKVKFLTKNLTVLNNEELAEMIVLIGDKQYLKLNQNRNHAKLKLADYNYDFAKALERKGYVSRVEEENDFLRVVASN